jgi:hypothetical protein
VVTLDFGSLGEELREAKVGILRALGIARTSFELTKQSQSIPEQLYFAARVFHLDHTELYFFYSATRQPIETISQVQSPQNELRVLIFLTKDFAAIQDPEIRSIASSLLSPLIQSYARNIPISPVKSIMKDEASVALATWAEANKYAHHLELGDFEDTGRGMALKSVVGANEPMIECDAGLFLSIFSAMRSEALGEAFQALPDLDDDSKLIIFVIYEKFVNPNSFWKAYLSHLPEVVDSALFFVEEDLEYLSGTTLGLEIGMIQEHFYTSYQEIMTTLATNPIFDPEVFTWERFKWARAIFDSRGFNLTLKGKARNCLLPFIDSINSTHFTHLQTRGYIDETRTGEFSDLGIYVLPTLTSCESLGNQVFLNYGGFSTRELVLFYGFVYEGEENPYDLFTLTLDLPEDDLADERMSLASKLNVTADHYLRSRSISQDLLLYLSIVLLPSDQVLALANQGCEELKASLLHSSGLSNVYSTLKSLLEALCENLLSENPFLTSTHPSFPSTRSRIGFHYVKSQLHILKSSMAILEELSK